jgi:hypothetical protein
MLETIRADAGRRFALAADREAVHERHCAHYLALLTGDASLRQERGSDRGQARKAFFEPAPARCGADAWEAAARDGAALTFEDAIAGALDEPRPA